MDTDLVTQNLLAPAVLAFFVGVVARLAKSDLAFPEAISQGMAIYLLFAIGLKGGTALSKQPDLSAVALPALATIVLGCMTAVVAYQVARRMLRLDRPDAGALSAHYGSTSAVTFLAASAYLTHRGVTYEASMPALLVVMEIPGIALALALAGGKGVAKAAFGVMVSKSIVLLTGGMVVGFLADREGITKIAGFFVDPFVGVLVLFLLDLGTAAAERLSALRGSWLPLVIFGVLVPLVHGCIGAVVGRAVGLSEGGATLLGVLCASASYIAAPAAVRANLPQADLGRCLAASLGVTFPFNLALGIPAYHWVAANLHW